MRGLVGVFEEGVLQGEWYDIVQSYTACTLTRSSDRLIALSGVASLYQKTLGDHYLFGMWRSGLEHHLSWSVSDPKAQREDGDREPSWAWCSTDGLIDCRNRKILRTTCIWGNHLRILDVHPMKLDSAEDSVLNTNRSPLDNRLTLRGHIMQVTSLGPKSPWRWRTGDQTFSGELSADFLGLDLSAGKIYYLLVLESSYRLVNCLLLSNTKTVTDISVYDGSAVDGVYRRVGLLITALITCEDMNAFGVKGPDENPFSRVPILKDSTHLSTISLI
jgi:hypothetical protein